MTDPTEQLRDAALAWRDACDELVIARSTDDVMTPRIERAYQRVREAEQNLRAALETPEDGPCEECEDGRVKATVCCGKFLSTGECCNQPVFDVVPCERCGGSGKAPDDPPHLRVTLNGNEYATNRFDCHSCGARVELPHTGEERNQ